MNGTPLQQLTTRLSTQSKAEHSGVIESQKLCVALSTPKREVRQQSEGESLQRRASFNQEMAASSFGA